MKTIFIIDHTHTAVDLEHAACSSQSQSWSQNVIWFSLYICSPSEIVAWCMTMIGANTALPNTQHVCTTASANIPNFFIALVKVLYMACKSDLPHHTLNVPPADLTYLREMHKGLTLLLGGIYEAALAAAATASVAAARAAVAAARAAEEASLQTPVPVSSHLIADPMSISRPADNAHPGLAIHTSLIRTMSTTTPPSSPQHHTAPDGTEMQMDTPGGDSQEQQSLADEIAQEKRRLHLQHAAAFSAAATPAPPASRRRSFPSTAATDAPERGATAGGSDTTTGTAAGAAAAAAVDDVVGLHAWSSMVSMLIRVAWDVGRLWGMSLVVGHREHELAPDCDSLLVQGCFLMLGRLLETHPHLLDVFLNDPRYVGWQQG